MRTRGFTLIELLVVIGMIAILTGAASSAVMKARTRAQIARATTETREMTKAIVAFENWGGEDSLSKHSTGGASSWKPATEGNLGFILGQETGRNGDKVPVLYNAAISGSEIRDPWGKPYEFVIAPAGSASESGADQVGTGLSTFMYLPNLFRLTEKERRGEEETLWK